MSNWFNRNDLVPEMLYNEIYMKYKKTLLSWLIGGCEEVSKDNYIMKFYLEISFLVGKVRKYWLNLCIIAKYSFRLSADVNTLVHLLLKRRKNCLSSFRD